MPGGVDENGKSFDKFFWLPTAYKAQWFQGKHICNTYGLGYMFLDSQNEADSFWSAFVQKSALFDQSTFLGAVTSIPKSPFDWYWVEHKKKVNIVINWAANQPDNWGGAEACLVISKKPGSYEIFDAPCYGEANYYKFLCQSYVWL